MNNHGKRMVQEDELTYLQNLKEEHPDPSAEWGGEGGSYQAGNGITISDDTISVNYGSGLTVADETLTIDTTTVAMKSDLATVATTGDYDDLTNKPTIPAAQVNSDWNAASGVAEILNKPTNIVTTDTTQTISGQKTVLTSPGAPLSIYGSGNDSPSLVITGNATQIPAKITGINGSLTLQPYNISGFEIADGARDRKFHLPTKSAGTYTLATEDEIPAAVSGTNDGTNWTSLTVGSDTYAIPSGGSGSSYTFTNGLTESSGTVSWDLNSKFNFAQSGRSAVSSDASSYDANNMCQNSCIYTPSDGLTNLSNNRYNNGLIAFGTGLQANSGGTTAHFNNLILVGRGLRVDYPNLDQASQIVIGSFNTSDISKSFIIGNGTSYSSTNNLLTVDRNGVLECTNIPPQPTADGNYVLKCSISSGVATYSWVLES